MFSSWGLKDDSNKEKQYFKAHFLLTSSRVLKIFLNKTKLLTTLLFFVCPKLKFSNSEGHAFFTNFVEIELPFLRYL